MTLIPIQPKKVKEITINKQKALANEDPLEKIAAEMDARGFGGELWAPRRISHVTGEPIPMVFTDKAKKLYLRTLATTGRKAYAAAACNLSLSCVQGAITSDPVFRAAVEEANEYFRDLIQAELIRRGIEGYHEEVLGGRERDQVFKLKKYSDKSIELLSKIHIAQLNKEAAASTVTNQNLTINNNSTFDLESMGPEELSMFKKLVEAQAKRDEGIDPSAALPEKVINP